MSWTRKGDLYLMVMKYKRELGDIPKETCPLIDSVITILENHVKDDSIKKDACKLMEDLRNDNVKLRSLGKDWYKISEEVCEEADKIIGELEDERDDFEKKWSEAEDEIKDLKQ
jgi:hypothetical protein